MNSRFIHRQELQKQKNLKENFERIKNKEQKNAPSSSTIIKRDTPYQNERDFEVEMKKGQLTELLSIRKKLKDRNCEDET